MASMDFASHLSSLVSGRSFPRHSSATHTTQLILPALASRRAMPMPFPSADLSSQIQTFLPASCTAWNLQPFQNLLPGSIQVRRPAQIPTGVTQTSQKQVWEHEPCADTIWV